MIDNWLELKEKKGLGYVFNLIEVVEKHTPDDTLLKFLQEKIITSYRNIDFYKFVLAEETEEKIREYIINQVIPIKYFTSYTFY